MIVVDRKFQQGSLRLQTLSFIKKHKQQIVILVSTNLTLVAIHESILRNNAPRNGICKTTGSASDDQHKWIKSGGH